MSSPFSCAFALACPTEQIKLLGEMVEGEGEINQMEVGATHSKISRISSDLFVCREAMACRAPPKTMAPSRWPMGLNYDITNDGSRELFELHLVQLATFIL